MLINIESSSNNVYKSTKKLLAANERRKTGKFIIEGYRIVADAVRHNADIDCIMMSESCTRQVFDDKYKVYRLADKLFEEISSTVNSQGIIAVVNSALRSEQELLCNDYKYIVYLDSVMDPGNMGTILRTCDAMGVDAVVASKGCVDIYNPKVVRSTMASIFNVPVFFDRGEGILPQLSKNGFNIVGTFPDGELPVYDCNLCGKTVVVMGNEANGISDDVAALCNTKITVPMLGGAESLNVAVCCGMILYEQLKQRSIMEV
ncbi:MAG: RNA methyltransferase [Clostridia bacterium]|nr:RNA methyltransferase [Clostridia bacterium]